jgi:ABC-type transporter Mla subunit MlaD
MEPVAKEPTSVPELNLADALQRGIGLRLDRRFAGVSRRIYFVTGLLIAVLATVGLALWSELRDLKENFALAKAPGGALEEQIAAQTTQLNRLDEKLDRNSAEAARALREVADQAARLGRLDEKLDKNLIAGARPVREVADQTARLQSLVEKLDKNLAEATRALQEAAVRIESKESAATPTPEAAPTFVAMTLSDGEREIIRKFFGVRKKNDAIGFDAKVGEIAPATAPLYPVPSLLYYDVPKLRDHRFFADETSGTIIIVRPSDNRVVAIV